MRNSCMLRTPWERAPANPLPAALDEFSTGVSFLVGHNIIPSYDVPGLRA